MTKPKKIRDMTFEEWLGLNEDRLRDDYHADVFDLLNLAKFNHPEYLDDIESFAQYSKDRFEAEKEDEAYEDRNP